MIQRILSIAIYTLSSGIGLAAFLYPFFMTSLEPVNRMGMAHANDAPIVLTILVVFCFGALLLEVQGQGVNTKIIALLGVLVAINSILRFVEVAIAMPGSFSPIFFLIIMTGYVYGAQFGFLMGVMTLIVSALITGGVGPWLPYQMYTAGWVGASAPLCRPVVMSAHRLLTRLASHRREWLIWAELGILSLFGIFWGFFYGAVMNIWFWPFVSGPAEYYWSQGIGITETLQRYAVFYLVTSLTWDLLRSLGNVLLIIVLGQPTLRALRRFKWRFGFSYHPLEHQHS
jgi:energy-coupling factor transport system substrate-specific component